MSKELCKLKKSMLKEDIQSFIHSDELYTFCALVQEAAANCRGGLCAGLISPLHLYSQTKQAHWNVKGIHFEELHVLFDKMADSIFAYADTIAERATALGGTALGTTRMAATASELPEFPADVFDGTTMLKVVVERWAQYASGVRAAANQADDAGDLDTSDMFVDVSRTADKMLWFAEAHLQGYDVQGSSAILSSK